MTRRLLAIATLFVAACLALGPTVAAGTAAASASTSRTPAVTHLVEKTHRCKHGKHKGNKHCKYPPNPKGPYSTESAGQTHVGQPVTFCGKNFSGNVPLQFTDNRHFVAVVHTNGQGTGCITVVWKYADGTAHPYDGGSVTGAAFRTTTGRSGYVLAAATLPRAAAEPRAAEARRMHTMTFTGQDKRGVVASTSQQETVIGRLSPGSHGRSTEPSSRSSGLPFTGLDVVAAVAIAAALIVVGMLILTGVRRRRSII